MAQTKIGAIIALDGEKDFRTAVGACSTSIRTMKSELKLLSTEYKGQANTMEALTKKQETLTKLLEKQEEKERTLNSALEASTKNRDKIKEQIDKQTEKLEEENKKLTELTETYGANSTQVKEQQEYIDGLNEKLTKNNENYTTACDRVEKWQTSLNNAKTETANTKQELSQLDTYLEEAEDSADGCAKSIDEFGKEVKDAGDDIGDAEDNTSRFADIVSGNIVSDLALDGLKSLGDLAKDAATKMVEVGSNFEAAMSNVQALSGATTSEFNALSAKAQELGASTQFSATEVANAFSYMSLAGWSADQSISGISGVLDLAAASGMDLAEASDMVTDYLSAFGLEASDATKMADQLAYAQANSNTTTEALGEAFKNSAANMNANGQSMETEVALLEAMANQGTKGAEAGTKLTAVMRDLNNNMDDGTVKIGDYNVAIADENGNYRQLTDIMSDINDATSDMSETERTAALSAVFTADSITAVNEVLAEGTDKVQGYKDELSECDGTASSMASTMNDNLNGKITTLNSALEGLGIAAYNYVSGPLQGVVSGVTTVISGITGLLTPQKTLIGSFVDEIKSSNDEVDRLIDNAQSTISQSDSDVANLEYYKGVLTELAGKTELSELDQYKLKDAVNAVGADIPEITAAYDEQNGTLDLTNDEIETLIGNQEAYVKQAAYISAQKDAYSALYEAQINVAKARQAEKDILEQASEITGTTIKSYDDMVYAMEDMTAADAENDAKMQQLIADYASATGAMDEATAATAAAKETVDLTNDVIDANTDAWNRNTKAMEETADAADETSTTTAEAEESISVSTQALIGNYTSLYSAMEDSIGGQIGLLNDMSDAFYDADGNIVDANGDIVESVGDTADQMMKDLDSQISAVDAWSTNLSELAKRGVDEGLLTKLAEMGPEGAKYAQALNSMSEDDLNRYQEKWSTLLDDVDMGGQVSDVLDEMATSLAGGQDQLTDAMNEMGINAETGFVNGMKEKISLAKDASEDTGDTVLDTIKSVLDINSPSVEMKKIGINVVSGLAQGINSKQTTVSTAMQKLANSVITTANTYLKASQFTTLGRNVAVGVSNGISNSASYSSTSASRMGASILNSVRPYCAASIYETLGHNIAVGLANGITKNAVYAVNAAVSMANKVISASKSALSINSPSKVFQEIGAFTAEGFGIGFQEQMQDVKNSVNSEMQSLIQDNSNSVSSMNQDDFGNSIYESMLSALSVNSGQRDQVINANLVIDGQVLANKIISLNSGYVTRTGRGMLE